MNVELPEDLAAKLSQRHSAMAAGEPVFVEQVVAEDLYALYDLEEHTRGEMAGRFTDAELAYILDVVNGWVIAWPGPHPSVMLQAEILDGARHHELHRKHFQDDPGQLDSLLDKVQGLTAFEAYVLLREAKLAWGTEDPLATLRERFKVGAQGEDQGENGPQKASGPAVEAPPF